LDASVDYGTDTVLIGFYHYDLVAEIQECVDRYRQSGYEVTEFKLPDAFHCKFSNIGIIFMERASDGLQHEV